MKQLLCTFLFLIYFFCFSLFSESLITYELNIRGGSRFGDTLVTYIRSKWLAYKYGFSFLYKPFKYSDQLMMHELEKQYEHVSFKHKVQIKKENDFIKKREQSDTLFFTGFYTETEDLYDFVVAHPDFAREIRSMAQPCESFTFDLPENMITVAVHVRKGTGFDKPLFSQQLYDVDAIKREELSNVHLPTKGYADVRWPTKFPPDQYYIDQLKYISEAYDHKPLFVHLFTDDPHPENLVQKYRIALNLENVTWSYRLKGNRHNANVVYDFYAMSQFDCLIRSDSRYAYAVQLIGNHKLVMYPDHGTWFDRTLIVDTIVVIDRNGKRVRSIHEN